MINRRGVMSGIFSLPVTGAKGFRNQFLPFFQAGQRVVINKFGEFIYNGAPAFGNLVASFASAPGNDPKGNSYLSGDVVYGTTGGITYACQIGWSAGVGSSLTLISFQTAASPAGPWTRQAIIDGDGSGNLNVSANASFNLSVGTGQEIFLGSYLDLPNVTAPGSVSGHTRPLAIGGNLAFVSGNDANTYDTGKQRVVSFTGGTQTISAITFANVTGATFNVGIGHYSIHVKVWLTTSAAAGAPQFQLTAPAVSSSSFMGSFTQTPGPTAPIGRANSSGFTPGVGLTLAGAGTGQIFDCEFDATFTAAGAVNLQALTTIAGDNFIINTVYIDLSPIN